MAVDLLIQKEKGNLQQDRFTENGYHDYEDMIKRKVKNNGLYKFALVR